MIKHHTINEKQKYRQIKIKQGFNLKRIMSFRIELNMKKTEGSWEGRHEYENRYKNEDKQNHGV